MAVSGAAGRPTMSGTIRVLETMNRKLLVRVKELELKLLGGTEQAEGKGWEPKESSDFTAAVKDLHGEIDAAQVLKNALEDELVATQNKLSKAETAGAQSAARASLLSRHTNSSVPGRFSATSHAAASCSASAARSSWTRSSLLAVSRISSTGWTSLQALLSSARRL